MKNALIGAHVSRRNESVMLTLTTVQAFLIGAFFSLFYVGSHILFLQSFSIEDFPMALAVSGIIGIVLFSAYTFLSSRISFKKLVLISLTVIMILNALIFKYYDSFAFLAPFGISLRLPFAFVFPLSILAILAYRRSIGNIYTPNQGRRFYPVIQGSFMTGIVLSSFALLGALFFFSWDFLYIMAASTATVALALLLQIVINLMHRYSYSFQPVAKRTNKLRSKFYEFFYTRYTFLLVLFILISSTIGFVLHYYFLKESTIIFESTSDLAKFFGFFMGTMFLFVFFLDRYLIRKILYTYDSPYSTMLIPVILTLAFIASLVVYLLGGGSTGVSVYSISFIMVVILRIGYETTYQAIELPSLRVLFRTLDLRFSGAILPRMEGSLRMVSLLFAGIILTLLLLIKLKIDLSVNILLTLLAMVWIPVTIKLIKAYQNALRETIRRLKASKRSLGQELVSTDEKSHELINSEVYEKVIHALHITENLEPLKYEMHLVSMLGSCSAEIRKHILEKIEEDSMLFSLPYLKEIQQESNSRQFNQQLTRLISRFENKISVGISRESIERLVNSSNITDRILAAEIIRASEDESLAYALTILSRDIEPEVKFATVKAMARMSHPDHAYILIGYLSTPAYYPYAFDALVRIGDPALPHLEDAFLLPDADNILLSRIVRIYGKIGTSSAIELLLGKLENQNRIIMHQALLALRESKFQATPDNINRILNDMVRLINIMSWNFAAFSSLGKSRRFDILRDALLSEIQENYNSLYHLLALAYNPTSISNIKNLLTEGNDNDISFAIELLDQIVHEEIKQVFLPVVENISFRDRFKQLQYYFHAVRLDPADLIDEIITRDFNSLSLYAKACAIHNILSLHRHQVSQELVACVFHPDRMLRESAAYVIHKLQPESLDSIYPRLDPQVAGETKLTLSTSGNGFPYLLLHRIRFLRECPGFSDISEEVLLEIVKELDLNSLNSGDEFLIRRNDVHYAFMIIFEGKAEVKISDEEVATFSKKDIIYSDIFIEDNTYSLKAVTDLKFYSLDQELLNALMFDHIEFRNAVLALVEEI